MTARAIVMCDLDGTLLDARGGLFDGVQALMRVCSDAGMAVALCSARPPVSVCSIASALSTPTYVAALQGALVYRREACPGNADETWALAHRTAMPQDVVVTLSRRLSSTSVWWYTSTGWFVDAATDAAHLEAEILGFTWDGVCAVANPTDVCKLLVLDPVSPSMLPDRIRGWGYPVSCDESKPGYIEIVSSAAGRDKGATRIRALVSPDIHRPLPIVAIGDGQNDIGLFLESTYSITFEDAPEEVRRAATLVVPANRAQAMAELASVLPALVQAGGRHGRDERCSHPTVEDSSS